MYLSNTAIWIIPQILYRIDRIPQDAQKSGYGPVWSDFLCHPRADPIFGYIHICLHEANTCGRTPQLQVRCGGLTRWRTARQWSVPSQMTRIFAADRRVSSAGESVLSIKSTYSRCLPYVLFFGVLQTEAISLAVPTRCFLQDP